MQFHPLLPIWVILLAALLSLAAILVAGCIARVKKAILVLRLCSLALLLLATLSPRILLNRTRKNDATLVFLLDGSSSMSTNDMIEGRSRFQVAAEALGRLEKESSQHSKKAFYLFNHSTYPLSKEELKSGAFRSGHPTGAPSGNTHLAQALETVDRDIGLASTTAIILISDGLDHSNLTAIPGGIPLFAVKTGTDLEHVPDLRLDAFSSPTLLRTGEAIELAIPVTLRQTSSSQEVSLQISIDGKPAKTESFTLQSEGKKEIPFKTAFDTPGLHTIQLDLNRMPTEASYINNSRELLVEVLEDTMAPVLYFPLLTNSFRPLVRLFAQTGRSYTALFRVRPGLYQVQGNSANHLYDHGIPANPEAMKETPLLFLGSGNAEDYTEAEIASFEAYAANGGTLIFYGGPDAFGDTSHRRFSALLPVRAGQSRFTDATFKLVSSKEGLFGELSKEALAIRGLNRVDAVKSGAEVLLSVEGEGNHPLVVAMPYGKGRVIAILTNSLHLLGTPRNRPRIFRAFWETMLLHAGTPTEELAIHAPDFLPEGTPLHVTATAASKDISSLQATLMPEDDTHAKPQTLAMKTQGGAYVCDFSPLPAGKYTLSVQAKRNNGRGITRYARLHCGGPASENDDLKVSDAAFLKLATRGRIYQPEETERLIRDLNALLANSQTEKTQLHLDTTPFLLAFLFLLLMVEWTLRRKANRF